MQKMQRWGKKVLLQVATNPAALERPLLLLNWEIFILPKGILQNVQKTLILKMQAFIYHSTVVSNERAVHLSICTQPKVSIGHGKALQAFVVTTFKMCQS
ncbi:hypothetical protein KFK09_027626 [Dendrobium nobile]|uniref:Uncharacterized protein n=1 Tax=Dendrobium nobile TaxID=94219 RepID=A0A8T3AB39_DENNO|nr:hypothetical protein KFK09_027626 [Dendrobium nobile]